MSKLVDEFPALSYVNFRKDDMVEVSKKVGASYQSHQTTVGELANYIKKQSNGGFRGVSSTYWLKHRGSLTHHNLDNFTHEHIGVWRFDGNDANLKIKQNSGALVEIISCRDHKEPQPGESFAVLLERVTYGPSVYQRYRYATDTGFPWGPWKRISNINGDIMQCGSVKHITANGYISFNDDRFAGYTSDDGTKVPSVTCSVLDTGFSKTNKDTYYIYQCQVTNVTTEGFSYKLYRFKYNKPDWDTEKRATSVYTSTKIPYIITKQTDNIWYKDSSMQVEVRSETTIEIPNDSSTQKNINGAWEEVTSDKVCINYIATMEVV